MASATIQDELDTLASSLEEALCVDLVAAAGVVRRAIKTILDLSEKLEAAEDERDALAARLQALEAPLAAFGTAAKYLGFALHLDEPVPVLEVRR